MGHMARAVANTSMEASACNTFVQNRRMFRITASMGWGSMIRQG